MVYKDTEYKTWSFYKNKLNHVLKFPEKYSTEELSIILDGFYQYGDPDNLHIDSIKSELKYIINSRANIV